MEQNVDILIDDKNLIVMKLLHYFITEKNYNPIILQGAENEIWLENLREDYKIVRIVSNHIHNNEQFDYDIFKTKRIIKKIKRKTLSLSINTLSIFLDLGDNVKLENKIKDIDLININGEEDLSNSEIVKSKFPDLLNKLEYTEEGMELFVKITNDINNHNKIDAGKVEEVFKPKYPLVTYILIALNIILYFLPVLFNKFDYVVLNFGLNPYLVKIGEFYRLLSCAFIHGNLLHLVFNCYALYVIGNQLESFVGKFKFFLIYLFSALCGSLMSMIFLKNGISIGASGAIFGLMGSLVYFGYHYRVYLGNIIRTQIIPLIIFNLVLGFIMSGIDNFAHIGGLIGGTVITMGLGIKYKSSKSEMINGLIISTVYLLFLIYMGFLYT